MKNGGEEMERTKNIHDIEKRAMLLDRAAILELVSLERKLRAVVGAAEEASQIGELTKKLDDALEALEEPK